MAEEAIAGARELLKLDTNKKGGQQTFTDLCKTIHEAGLAIPHGDRREHTLRLHAAMVRHYNQKSLHTFRPFALCIVRALDEADDFEILAKKAKVETQTLEDAEKAACGDEVAGLKFNIGKRLVKAEDVKAEAVDSVPGSDKKARRTVAQPSATSRKAVKAEVVDSVPGSDKKARRTVAQPSATSRIARTKAAVEATAPVQRALQQEPIDVNKLLAKSGRQKPKQVTAKRSSESVSASSSEAMDGPRKRQKKQMTLPWPNKAIVEVAEPIADTCEPILSEDALAHHRAVLGVPVGASPAEIRAAYRRRAREKHPDKGGSCQEFREVAKAFEALRAPSASSARIDMPKSAAPPDPEDCAPMGVAEAARWALAHISAKRDRHISTIAGLSLPVLQALDKMLAEAREVMSSADADGVKHDEGWKKIPGIKKSGGRYIVKLTWRCFSVECGPLRTFEQAVNVHILIDQLREVAHARQLAIEAEYKRFGCSSHVAMDDCPPLLLEEVEGALRAEPAVTLQFASDLPRTYRGKTVRIMSPFTPNLQHALEFRSIIKRVLGSAGAPLPTCETEMAVKEMMLSKAKKDRAAVLAMEDQLRQAVHAEIQRRHSQTAVVPVARPEFTQNTQPRRPTTGDQVVVIATGKMGTIVHDDQSCLPYEVDISGERSVYSEADVKVVGTSSQGFADVLQSKALVVQNDAWERLCVRVDEGQAKVAQCIRSISDDFRRDQEKLHHNMELVQRSSSEQLQTVIQLHEELKSMKTRDAEQLEQLQNTLKRVETRNEELYASQAGRSASRDSMEKEALKKTNEKLENELQVMSKEKCRIQKSLEVALQRATGAAKPGGIQLARIPTQTPADSTTKQLAAHTSTTRQAVLREARTQHQCFIPAPRDRCCLTRSASAESVQKAFDVVQSLRGKRL